MYGERALTESSSHVRLVTVFLLQDCTLCTFWGSVVGKEPQVCGKTKGRKTRSGNERSLARKT
eukprot:5995188-Amphidinium_carterae.1